MDFGTLLWSLRCLMGEAQKEQMANTRIGNLAAAAKLKEAALLTDQIGGAQGAEFRADVYQRRSSRMLHSDNMAAAAQDACSSLRAARASGSRTVLVGALFICGDAAKLAPIEMVNAERESRERRCGSALYGGLDLSQEGWVSLPTTPAGLSRLSLAYNEAAVAIRDAALAGNRGRLAAHDDRLIPDLRAEAWARGSLGAALFTSGEDPQRSLELLRRAVALRRQVLRTAALGRDALDKQRGLANELSVLGVVRCYRGSDGFAEAGVCLREAFELAEAAGSVRLAVKTGRYLINLCGEVPSVVGPAEAEAFRSRRNHLLVQMGRSPETSCSICLESLAPPADGVAGGGGSGGAGGPPSWCVRVLECSHQFHHGCLLTWQRTASTLACPLCKK